ncbi:MAG: sensor histidine kinase [Thermoanaerobaculia bacterium]
MRHQRVLHLAIATAATAAAIGFRYAGVAQASIPLGIAALASAAVAMVAWRARAGPILAIAIAVAAAVDVASAVHARRIVSAAESGTAENVRAGARRIARHLQRLDADLQRELDEVAAEIGGGTRDPLAIFDLLARYETPNRGFRVMDPAGRLVAWWGEDLPGLDGRHWRFDVTNVYVNRRAIVGGDDSPLTIDRYERVLNFDSEPLQKIAGEATASVKLHAGALEAEPGARRFIVAREADADLFADLLPRAPEAVAEEATQRARTAAAVAIAIGILLAAGAWAMRSGRDPRATALAWGAGLILARSALLEMRPPDDPLSIFGFDLYASRILGPFTRSPADLLLTAAALAVLGHLAMKFRGGRWTILATIAQPLAILAATAGLVRLVENFAANSRIPAIPPHIVPHSPAQSVLLAATILLGLAAIQLTRHRGAARATLVPAAVVVAGGVAALVAIDEPVRGTAFAVAASVLTVALLVHALFRDHRSAVVARALLAAALVYPPVALFEASNAQEFIAETYAPLVAGESELGMIETALAEDLGHVDLRNLLPDTFDRTYLRDLAYALWLRSNLAEWDVPVVIVVTDLEGYTLSRFGVGLPQFTETGGEGETLVIGRTRRNLLHFPFELAEGDEVRAAGTVHIVNPGEPGSTALADIYRPFLVDPGEPPPITSRYRSEPAVFDREGIAWGPGEIRLARSPGRYFEILGSEEGLWTESSDGETIYLRRSGELLYAFPLELPGVGEHFRRAGGLAIWAALVGLAALAIYHRAALARFVRGFPNELNFRTRTALWLGAVVLLPLLVFLVFVRAFLEDRLQSEYLARGQAALNTAQRVIEDYLDASEEPLPEQVLSDPILTWLARVIGHDLHLYGGSEVIASSRRDLFTANVESPRLPGHVYAETVLRGREIVFEEHQAMPERFIEIYSPIMLGLDRNYTLALPFIVQARQIEQQVGDLATNIYLLLILIVAAALFVAWRTSRTVTRPVQELVGGARDVAAGRFDLAMDVPRDPDLRLLVTTFRDMSESIQRQQEDLRHERDRLQTLLENITAAVVVLDGERRIVATNRAARAVWSLPPRPSPDARFAPRFAEVERFLDERRPGHVASEEIALEVDGSERTYRLTSVPLPESDEEMLIAEDVTEILRSNRIEAWAEMARQVAHEIKNPLTPIQLTAEHLRTIAERRTADLPTAVRSGVDNILRQVETLRETSREFSDYASLRQPNRRLMDLRALLEEIVAGYAQRGHDGVRLTSAIDEATPRRYWGDERLLRGAITNLIENALQASPAGGAVDLATRVADGRVVISVRDSGPGVDPHVLPRIFDPYFSTKSSGTGLGLAIARKSIEEHGGAIHAENVEGGFLVAVDLPVAEPPGREPGGTIH